MAGPPPAAIKQRIMAHMNADHADSLDDYLKFYNNVTAAPASAKLIDFDLDYMRIEYRDTAGITHSSLVKIDPPMGSLGESRVRLVAMAEEATGKSFHQPPDVPSPTNVPTVPDIAVKAIGWTPPGIVGLLTLAAIYFGFWALHHPYPLSPEGPVKEYLPVFLVEFGRKYREQLFAGMIGIHAIEAISNARTCWEAGTSIPILIIWTVNAFFEGGPAMVRLNKLVENRTKIDETGRREI
jgi:hypothetical protein